MIESEQNNKYFFKIVYIEDLEVLHKISVNTFYESFAHLNSEENMQKYLLEEVSVEKLKLELLNSHSQFYFLYHLVELVGYLKINFGSAQTELKNCNAIEIERIYVINTFQNKGVGQLLFEKALEIAKDKKVEFMWLAVWEKNERAIKFYKKNGMELFDQHFFMLGNEQQTDLMMKIMIN